MTTAIILIVVALVAAGLFFALRKPAQLPPAPPTRALPEKEKDKKPAQLAETRREPQRAPTPEEVAKIPSIAPEALIEDKGPSVPAPPPSRPRRDVSALRKGLAASRGGFIARLRALVSGKKEIDPAILEQMEEVMLSSDVGVQTTQAILGRLRDRLDKNELSDETAVWDALRAEATEMATYST